MPWNEGNYFINYLRISWNCNFTKIFAVMKYSYILDFTYFFKFFQVPTVPENKTAQDYPNAAFEWWPGDLLCCGALVYFKVQPKRSEKYGIRKFNFPWMTKYGEYTSKSWYIASLMISYICDYFLNIFPVIIKNSDFERIHTEKYWYS